MQRHRNGTLAQAMALLIQNQAAFVSQQVESDKARAEADRRTQMMELRILHIERMIEEIRAILVRHERILKELPETLRQKIGFKTK
jgi:hypothetical protein